MAKLRIRHVRETLRVCFIGMRTWRGVVCINRRIEGKRKTETRLREKRTENGVGGGGKEEQKERKKELGQHYPAIKSLG